jgi:hypothetical protein
MRLFVTASATVCLASRLAHSSAASHEPVSGPDQVFIDRCVGLDVTIYRTPRGEVGCPNPWRSASDVNQLEDLILRSAIHELIDQ